MGQSKSDKLYLKSDIDEGEIVRLYKHNVADYHRIKDYPRKKQGLLGANYCVQLSKYFGKILMIRFGYTRDDLKEIVDSIVEDAND